MIWFLFCAKGKVILCAKGVFLLGHLWLAKTNLHQTRMMMVLPFQLFQGMLLQLFQRKLLQRPQLLQRCQRKWSFQHQWERMGLSWMSGRCQGTLAVADVECLQEAAAHAATQYTSQGEPEELQV